MKLCFVLFGQLIIVLFAVVFALTQAKVHSFFEVLFELSHPPLFSEFVLFQLSLPLELHHLLLGQSLFRLLNLHSPEIAQPVLPHLVHQLSVDLLCLLLVVCWDWVVFLYLRSLFFVGLACLGEMVAES